MRGNILYRLIYSGVLQSAQFYLFMWLFWRTPSTLKIAKSSPPLSYMKLTKYDEAQLCYEGYIYICYYDQRAYPKYVLYEKQILRSAGQSAQSDQNLLCALGGGGGGS